MRVCRLCGDEKPLATFQNGASLICGGCRYRRDRNRPDHAVNRAKQKRARKFRKYGITEQEYDAMFAAQDGLCAICKKPEERGTELSIDHDHETGAVRRLLCRSCNLVIGYAHEDVQVLRNAIDYLESFVREVPY